MGKTDKGGEGTKEGKSQRRGRQIKEGKAQKRGRHKRGEGTKEGKTDKGEVKTNTAQQKEPPNSTWASWEIQIYDL